MIINKSFEVEASETGAVIAEAFGIEAGYENKIISELTLPDELPQITYITGESGCGKSTLLRELGLEEKKYEIPDRQLHEWIVDKNECLKLLSLVGLGDATLFVSYYHQLSDSQKARAKMFLALSSNDKTIVIDEFLATLDRKTAQAVSYCFQKAVKSLEKNLIVVTSHFDLEEYLQPDLIIKGYSFPSRWDVIEKENKTTNPFLNKLKFEYKDKYWYRECRLGELHYKGKYTGGVKEHLAAYVNGELVGFLIGIYRMHDGGRRISRLVTHPSYRGVGIGAEIVKEYLTKHPTADVVAVMAHYNPVFEKAGMKRLPNSKYEPPAKLKSRLKEVGFDVKNWHNRDYCLDFMNKDSNRKILLEFLKQISFLVCSGGVYHTDEELTKKIIHSEKISGRVLWNLRPKEYAKFIGEFK